LIFRSHDLEVAPLASNLHIAPPVPRHLLADLFLGHRPVAGNEDRSSSAALPIDVDGGDASHKQHHSKRPHQYSVRHRHSPSASSKEEHPPFKAVLTAGSSAQGEAHPAPGRTTSCEVSLETATNGPAPNVM